MGEEKNEIRKKLNVRWVRNWTVEKRDREKARKKKLGIESGKKRERIRIELNIRRGKYTALKIERKIRDEERIRRKIYYDDW